MAVAKKKPSKNAKLNEENNNQTEENKGPGIGSKVWSGAKIAAQFTGDVTQGIATTGAVYGIGAVVFITVSSYFGLGIVGTLLVLAGIFLAVELVHVIMGKRYAAFRSSLSERAQALKAKATS